jgi:hypothetical protein
MLRLLPALLLITSTIAAQDSLLRELVPLLPKESKLTFSQWKADPQQSWLRGSAKGYIPNTEGCDGAKFGNGTIIITYDFYNTQTESGKGNLLSEKAYISDMYNAIKTSMTDGIESEKRSLEYLNVGKVTEEEVGEGKAFYYARTVACTSSPVKYSYVSYIAYIPVRSGFLQVDLNYYGSVEKVKAYVKEIYNNIKTFDAYNFFSR